MTRKQRRWMWVGVLVFAALLVVPGFFPYAIRSHIPIFGESNDLKRLLLYAYGICGLLFGVPWGFRKTLGLAGNAAAEGGETGCFNMVVWLFVAGPVIVVYGFLTWPLWFRSTLEFWRNRGNGGETIGGSFTGPARAGSFVGRADSAWDQGLREITFDLPRDTTNQWVATITASRPWTLVSLTDKVVTDMYGLNTQNLVSAKFERR